MELAAQIGISIVEFWQITPYELSIVAKGFAKRKAEEQKEGIMQAYIISRFVWQKRINIKRILEAGEKKKAMTDDQMLNQVRKLNVMLGGVVNEAEK